MDGPTHARTVGGSRKIDVVQQITPRKGHIKVRAYLLMHPKTVTLKDYWTQVLLGRAPLRDGLCIGKSVHLSRLRENQHVMNHIIMHSFN